MISIETAAPDAAGHQGPTTQQIAPGVSFDPATGVVILSDGKQALAVKITAE